ncbi:hypothetical protein PG997_011352 [Apiospora hydei]|uniref:Ubiquitin-like protease family profile domain-containing protein n=1 Tax=Apiospora hydei TaxID=1337664 RepID=A0ABR1VMK4_9PEZI
MSGINKTTQGTKKSSPKPSVLGPQTKGASIQKAKSVAPLKGTSALADGIIRDLTKKFQPKMTGQSVAGVGPSTTAKGTPSTTKGTPDFDMASSVEDNINYTVRHAQVFSDQTFDFRMSLMDTLMYLDPTKYTLTDGNNIMVQDMPLWGLVQGLNNLQHSHRGWLLASAIEYPTRHWLDFLPKEAAGKIYYPAPGEWEFHEMFHRSSGKTWVQTMNDALEGISPQGVPRAVQLFEGFLTHEYTCSTGIPGATGKPGIVRHVHLRLRGMLGLLGCTFAAADVERTLWMPEQRDSYSCGIITAYINQLLIERIADQYMPSGPQQYDDAALWRPGSERFNPREFQGHLTGLVAVELMRATGYRGRVTVALVNETTSRAVDRNDFAAQTVSSDPTKFTLTPSRSSLKPEKRPTQAQTDRVLVDLRERLANGLQVLKKEVPPAKKPISFTPRTSKPTPPAPTTTTNTTKPLPPAPKPLPPAPKPNRLTPPSDSTNKKRPADIEDDMMVIDSPVKRPKTTTDGDVVTETKRRKRVPRKAVE